MGISKGRGKSCCIFFFSFCFVTMKFFALIACLAVASAYDQAWEDYKLEFNKLYTAAEELTRYATPSLLSDTEAKVVRITTWSRTRGEPDGEPEDTSRWHETGQTTAVLHPNHPTPLSKLIEINGNDRWMEEDMNLLFEHF